MNKFCQNCGAQLDEGAVFCAACGAQQTQPVEPVQPATQYTPYQTYNQAPVYVAPPVRRASVKSKVLGGIGLGLSIFGAIWEGIWALYSWIFFMASMGESSMAGAGFAFFIYAMIFMAFPIVGTVLCGIASRDVVTPATARIGKVFGIIGIIMGGVAGFFAFFSLLIAMASSY